MCCVNKVEARINVKPNILNFDFDFVFDDNKEVAPAPAPAPTTAVAVENTLANDDSRCAMRIGVFRFAVPNVESFPKAHRKLFWYNKRIDGRYIMSNLFSISELYDTGSCRSVPNFADGAGPRVAKITDQHRRNLAVA